MNNGYATRFKEFRKTFEFEFRMSRDVSCQKFSARKSDNRDSTFKTRVQQHFTEKSTLFGSSGQRPTVTPVRLCARAAISAHSNLRTQ